MKKYVISLSMLQKVNCVDLISELSSDFLVKDISDKKYLGLKYLGRLCTKHLDWSYEKEWKSIIKSSDNKAQSFISVKNYCRCKCFRGNDKKD